MPLWSKLLSDKGAEVICGTLPQFSEAEDQRNLILYDFTRDVTDLVANQLRFGERNWQPFLRRGAEWRLGKKGIYPVQHFDHRF